MSYTFFEMETRTLICADCGARHKVGIIIWCKEDACFGDPSKGPDQTFLVYCKRDAAVRLHEYKKLTGAPFWFMKVSARADRYFLTPGDPVRDLGMKPDDPAAAITPFNAIRGIERLPANARTEE
jgi:hypothetical protein